MGLFGQKKTFMDYVQQRSPETLRKMGLIYGFLHVEFFCSKTNRELWNCYESFSDKQAVLVVRDMSDCHMLRRYTVFSESGERLPRRYKQNLVTGQEWLEWACEAGDPDAPFYLSLMYEYGMTHETLRACGTRVARSVVQQSRDPERARQYLALAEERKSKLHTAYLVLSLHPLMKNLSGGAVDDADYRLYHICQALCTDAYENRETVQKIAGKEGYQELCRFMSVLLAFYAGQDFPGCLIYFGILLSKLLRDCNCREDLFAQKYSADFFTLKYFLLGKEHVQKTVNLLSARMDHLISIGDKGISFVQEDLGARVETEWR